MTAEGSLADDATLTIRVPRPDVEPLLPAADPCENCGTRVLIGNLADALGAELGPLARAVAGDRMLERHVAPTADGAAVVFRAHTPERCRAARAGDPEPLDLTDDEEDDEDG